jgi:hypothetical protein
MRRARDRYIRGRRLFANRAENAVNSGPEAGTPIARLIAEFY